MLVTVYPGGSFSGLSFEVVVQLRDFQNLGREPVYESEREARLAWFEKILFGYQQGAYASLEVLHASERVLGVFACNK